MKEKIRLIVGIIWASPVTLIAFIFYVMPLWMLTKYEYVGWDEVAWVFSFNPANQRDSWLTRFLRKKWQRWAGATLGSLIVIKDDPSMKKSSRNRTMIHEKEHVRQIMVLGVFQPIFYVSIYLIGRFVLRNVNGYYDNIFEIDARRRASELIDVVGVIKKLKEP